MNKKELVKNFIVLLAVAISFYFMINADSTGINSIFNLLNIIDFMFALTIFMFCNMKKIKKNKFVYDVVLMLLMFFSTAWICYFIYNIIVCFASVNCEIENTTFFILIYPTILFLMILFNISDIFNKTNKVNYILTIVVSVVVISVHLRYYFDPSFANNIIENFDRNEFTENYVIQNYIYFVIMYLIVLINKAINKDG